MKRNFLTGLIFLLPIALTIALVVWLVNTLTLPFLFITVEYLSSFITNPSLLLMTARLLILIVLFLFTLIIGALTRWVVIHYLISFGEAVLQRIPLVNLIYRTLREFIHTLFSQQSNSFKQVVLVSFPQNGMKMLGFITNEEAHKEKFFVFIPTAPNPTSGFLVLSDKEHVTPLKMSVEEAIKAVLSCGATSINLSTQGLYEKNTLHHPQG